MRNLKKVLAMALVFVFALTLVPAASALDFKDSGDIRNGEAVELLVSLGILKGYTTGRFEPLDDLSRAEAAKMIYVAMRGEDDGAKLFAGESLFRDVDRGHWAEGYINYASAMGLVAGTGNGCFHPNDTVTGYELSKMLLTALGYDQNAEKFVGTNWQFNVLALAIRHGITAGFDSSLAAPITRDDAACLFANAIYASTVSYDANMRPSTTGVSFGEEHLGLTAISGILVANTEAAIESASITEKGSIISVDGKTVLVPAASTVDQLGCAVTSLVQVKSGMSLRDAQGGFNSAAIAKAYGSVATDDANTRELELAKDDVAEGAKYYVNFGASDKNTVDELGLGHDIRAISNDGDNEIDIVLAIKYSYADVSRVTSTGTVTVSGSRYTDENAVGLKGLEAGDKVVFYKIENGKTIFGEPDVFKGTAEGYTADYVIIDGERMATATGISGFKPEDAPLGKEATYYRWGSMILDCAEESTGETANYALVLRATKIGWNWQAEILTSDGSKATFTVANPDDVVKTNDIPFGLYDLTVEEDGKATLKAVDAEGDTYSQKFSYESGYPKFGEKFVDRNTLMFLEIEGEWRVVRGMTNIPSFEGAAEERKIYTVIGDLYGTEDYLKVAVLRNVKLSDREDAAHYIIMSDIVNIADGKVRFSAWNGSSIEQYTASAKSIEKGGIYTFTMNASGVVTEAEEVTGTEGILTHASDLILVVGTAGSGDSTVVTYGADTKATIVDFTTGTVENVDMAELPLTPADAVEEMEGGEVDTLIVLDDSGSATHVYRFINEEK